MPLLERVHTARAERPVSGPGRGRPRDEHVQLHRHLTAVAVQHIQHVDSILSDLHFTPHDYPSSGVTVTLRSYILVFDIHYKSFLFSKFISVES